MSRIDFGAKPFLFPMPVLIIGTYDENGVPNAMNAAWGMITDYQEITISLSEHKTTENLTNLRSQDFMQRRAPEQMLLLLMSFQ